MKKTASGYDYIPLGGTPQQRAEIDRAVEALGAAAHDLMLGGPQMGGWVPLAAVEFVGATLLAMPPRDRLQLIALARRLLDKVEAGTTMET